MENHNVFAIIAVYLVAALGLNAQTPSMESGSASSTVTGYVTNSASGGVLNRASIVVEGTAQRTVTTRDGKYSLAVPPGHYTITASYAGLDVPKIRATIRG